MTMSIESAMKELRRMRETLIADKLTLERQAKALEGDIAVIHRA